MRRQIRTEADVLRAITLVDGMGHTHTSAAKIMGVPRQTLSGWVSEARLAGVKPGSATAESDEKRERISQQDKIRELESELRTIHRDNLTADHVRQSIIGLSEEIPDPPNWTVKNLKSGSAGIPVTLWSDWHWGEVVDPTQINGINEFSIAIAQRRVKKLVEKIISLWNRQEGRDAPGIIVCLGGDMVSGSIHEEITETNELPTMPVVIDLMGVLIWAIKAMADEFGKVFVPCVAGNHGRDTVKPRNKNYNYTNFDWLLYSLLEKHFEDDSRIQFMVPMGMDAHFSVAGTKFLLTHGNNLGTAGGDGIIGILGPVIRGDFKTRNQFREIGLPYDVLMIGHYHQYIATPRVVINGALKGFDEYAKAKLRAIPEVPSQAFFLVHKEHGITSHWPIHLEDEKPKANAEWVAWLEEQ